MNSEIADLKEHAAEADAAAAAVVDYYSVAAVAVADAVSEQPFSTTK